MSYLTHFVSSRMLLSGIQCPFFLDFRPKVCGNDSKGCGFDHKVNDIEIEPAGGIHFLIQQH